MQKVTSLSLGLAVGTLRLRPRLTYGLRAVNIRVPTEEDYRFHDGLHYRHLWCEVGDDWLCPGCELSKYQIMRWTKPL